MYQVPRTYQGVPGNKDEKIKKKTKKNMRSGSRQGREGTGLLFVSGTVS